MAKILISYYKVQELNKKGILGFWGGLFKDFIEQGNDLFVINTAYYNNYFTNEIRNNIINKKLLNDVQVFNPDIIITFNHRIPKIILDNFLDVPIYIWDGDELKYFCDLDYIDQTGHGIPLIVKNYGKDAFYISEHTIIVTIPLNKGLLNDVTSIDEYSDLNEAETKILSLIKSNNSYNIETLMKLTNYSRVYINKIIRSLKDKGYLKREGAYKNGYWSVLK